MPRYKSRPSKFSSILGVIVGIGILIVFLSEFNSSPTFPGQSGGSGFGIFGVVFVLALLGIIGYNIFNAATGKGYDEVIDVDDSDRDHYSSKPGRTSDSANEKNNVAKRLSELEQLKNDGLITEDEFAAKRQEIIKSL